ncbi:MAG: ABC-F family ATP-binding cassette domain-containing protein [Planctomycetes bacterium]|nr:ABC-F family ATP-binding cassette domain-containing protein [Planctomycetota bacterium]
MTLATLHEIVRRFGDQDVLTGATLRVDEGERIGVVGDNGSGKTTLIRILAGVDEPDGGTRSLRKNLRIAYAEQIPEFEPGTTVRELVQRGDGSFDELGAQVAELERRLAERPDDERLLRDYGELQGAFEAGGGYDRDHLCERVLDGIGFRGADVDKDVAVLSGGETSRTLLASLMTAPADLLILDEPTNHLDLDGIAFVEDFVQRYPGAVVTVSHDRRFLDAVAKRIVEVTDGVTVSFRGNWTAWRKQKDERLLAEARAFKNQQAFIEKELDYVRRNMGSRMSRQAKGRLKKLARLEIVSRPKGPRAQLRLQFGDRAKGLRGQTMVEAEGLRIRIGSRVLLEDGAFRIDFGDTVALVGRNGCGKTTLLQTIAGSRRADGGVIRFAHGLRVGQFSQEVTDLPHGVTVLEALRAVDLEATEKQLRDHLALFLFTGDEVEAQVDGLSGGEKQRLSLARLTRSHHDVLLLDEPTNHLDVDGREGLEQALRAFPGCVLLITHDRELLANVCDRVLYLEDRRLRTFDGGLEECMRRIAEERQAARAAEQAAKERAREQRRLEEERAAASRVEPATAGKPQAIRNPVRFQQLEEEIIGLEEQLEVLRADMAREENYRDAERLRSLQARERDVQERLATAYERWENWS